MRWLLLPLVALLLSACGAQQVVIVPTPTPGPRDCTPENLARYAEDMGVAIEDYQEQAELVGTVSRVSIAGPLQRLLDLQNEAEEIVAPACVENHMARVIAAMANHQSKFQDFAAQRLDDSLIAAGLITAQEQLEGAAKELDAIGTGTPPPTAETLAEPEPVVIESFQLLSPIAGGGEGNTGTVCAADDLEIIARQDIAGTPWVHVRVVAIGEADEVCGAVAGGNRVAVGDEGWLRDAEVFAPGSAPPAQASTPVAPRFPFAATPNGTRQLAEEPDGERTGGRLCSTAQLEVIEQQVVKRLAWYRVEVTAAPECVLSEPLADVGDTGWLAEGDFIPAP